jgi:hypothetical protein
VQRMLDCIAKGQAPEGITAEQVHAAVARHMPHLKPPKAKAKPKARGKKR